MADDELRRLERDAEHPDDDDAALRLDAALRRAGRKDELRARFRFRFMCPLSRLFGDV